MSSKPSGKQRVMPNRQRRRRRQVAGGPTLGLGAPSVTAVSRNQLTRLRVPADTIRFSNRELITAWNILSNQRATLALDLSPQNLPWLKNVAANYALVKWHRVRIIWPAGVPTTDAGQVGTSFVAGRTVTWTLAANVSPMSLVNGTRCCAVTPVWEPHSLEVPQHLLSRLPWYDNDTGSSTSANLQTALVPGSIVCACTWTGITAQATNVTAVPPPGVWIEYEVSLREPVCPTVA